MSMQKLADDARLGLDTVRECERQPHKAKPRTKLRVAAALQVRPEKIWPALGELPASVGDAARRWREALGLSQEKLIDELGGPDDQFGGFNHKALKRDLERLEAKELVDLGLLEIIFRALERAGRPELGRALDEMIDHAIRGRMFPHEDEHRRGFVDVQWQVLRAPEFKNDLRREGLKEERRKAGRARADDWSDFDLEALVQAERLREFPRRVARTFVERTGPVRVVDENGGTVAYGATGRLDFICPHRVRGAWSMEDVELRLFDEQSSQTRAIPGIHVTALREGDPGYEIVVIDEEPDPNSS